MNTLEECATALEGLRGVEGTQVLADSLRKNEVPIMLVGNLNTMGHNLTRITNRIREIILEEQRRETQSGS